MFVWVDLVDGKPHLTYANIQRPDGSTRPAFLCNMISSNNIVEAPGQELKTGKPNLYSIEGLKSSPTEHLLIPGSQQAADRMEVSGWGNVEVHAMIAMTSCQRQAMMFLQTSDMLVLGPKEPPHDARTRQQKRRELQAETKAGHSSNICLSSSAAPVLPKLQRRLA